MSQICEVWHWTWADHVYNTVDRHIQMLYEHNWSKSPESLVFFRQSFFINGAIIDKIKKKVHSYLSAGGFHWSKIISSNVTNIRAFTSQECTTKWKEYRDKNARLSTQQLHRAPATYTYHNRCIIDLFPKIKNNAFTVPEIHMFGSAFREPPNNCDWQTQATDMKKWVKPWSKFNFKCPLVTSIRMRHVWKWILPKSSSGTALFVVNWSMI